MGGNSQVQGLLPKHTDTQGTGDVLGCQKEELTLQPSFCLSPCPWPFSKELLMLFEGTPAYSAIWLSLLTGVIPPKPARNWRFQIG